MVGRDPVGRQLSRRVATAGPDDPYFGTSMSRLLLLALAVLLALLVLGRLNRPAAAIPIITPAVVARLPEPRPPPPVAPALSPSAGTPTIDLLARLEGRRRLGRAARLTYFDSLFAETDSVVRRWPDHPGTPLVLAIPPGDSARYDAGLATIVRQAVATWEGAGLGLHFALSTDTAGAQIVVHGSDQLQGERVGQTDIQWTREGSIHFALITLARR